MNKFYALFVVGLLFAVTGKSQDFYWIGADFADWNIASNWSNNSSGTPAASTYPGQTPGAGRVILRGAEKIAANADLRINAILVNNNATAVIRGVDGGMRMLTLSSTNPVTPALQIDAGARLEGDATDGTEFYFEFPSTTGQAVINGEWYLGGDVNTSDYVFFMMPPDPGGSFRLNVNNGGKITIGPDGFSPIGDNVYIVFNDGSTLELANDQAIIFEADYHENSTILITGVVDQPITFEEFDQIGNLTYNCPGQTNSAIPGDPPPTLGLFGLNILGDINILNTNDQELSLIKYDNSIDNIVTIEGDLNIQGNSRVSVGYKNNDNDPSHDKLIDLIVNGNLTAAGNQFSLQSSNFSTSKATTLQVKGNIQHTAGTFTALSNQVSNSANLYVIEMNGTSGQTITSHNGSFNNAANQIALKINNSSGVTLSSPLTVGRVTFAAGNINTSSSNELTINSTDNPALAIGGPSNTSYVNGPVRRRTISTDTLELPTGAGGVYRPVYVAPATTDETVFEGTYFNAAPPNSSALSPLEGIVGYYWDVQRRSGIADAAVKLTLYGAIAGADGDDAIVAAKYNGADWAGIRFSGANGSLAGDGSSGFVVSGPQTSFGLFTLGFGLNSALPTTLISFTARKVAESTAKLSWKITSNSTPEVFEIMRSSDGVHFSKIGAVKGVEDLYQYEFTDASMLNGNNYYRLRMVDKDGVVKLSTILVVMNGAKGLVISSMQPTLVRDRAKLNISAAERGNLQLVITDINGRIVQTQTSAINTGNQEVWISASRLANGIFHITGYFNGEKTVTLRFIKQ